MEKHYGIALLLVLLATITNAQYFQTGQDPASLKWRQINTPNFQVIYPDDYEFQAQQIANMLEQVYSYGSNSLKYKPKKISVILHTRTVQSNGLLAWAPRRVEFYATPHQAIYPQDWLEQLVLHEFRHVVQVGKISEELPVIIKLLLAQQGAALVAGAYLPFWFLEGDAVSTETALSKTGRGRSPSFLMQTQAQVIEKGIYSFDKSYLGSYKDFVPDFYKMGYYLVGGARNHFGAGIWENVVKDVGRKPFSITPLRRSLKKQTGMNQKQLYQFVFDSLKTEWVKKSREHIVANHVVISKPSSTYTNYLYNHVVGTDSIISYKTTFDRVAKFIIIDSDGNETNLLTPGTIFKESVNVTGNLLTWTENIPDIRWEHGGKSLIHIFNIKTREREKFFAELKGVSPAISPDKQKLALVEVDYTNNYFLSVYDIKWQKPVLRFQLEGNPYLFTPEWINDNELVLVALNGKGKCLVRVNPFIEKIEFLTDESLGDIKQPVVNGNEVYFISSYAGKNDLYVINLNNKEISRVFNSKFGVGYPAIKTTGNEVILSNYSAGGYRLISALGAANSSEPIEDIKKARYLLADKLASQEKGVVVFSKNDSVYKSKAYSKAANLFHFHSWLPLYFDASSYDIMPGVSLFSQNKLGTAETEIGYKYDTSEKCGKLLAKFTYKGWYPLISLEVGTGRRKSKYYSVTNYTNDQGQVIKSDTSLNRFNWKETTLDLSAKLPLEFSRGMFYRLLQPEVQLGLTQRNNVRKGPEWFTTGIINSLSYRLYYHLITKRSYRDLVPDFGVIIDLSYRHSPASALKLGNLAAAQMVNYLPGLLHTHGFVIYNGAQHRYAPDSYTFTDVLRYPRGWGKYINNNFMYSLSVNYKMPLFYPDFNIGNLMYIKRVKTCLYADYAYQEGEKEGGSEGQEAVQKFNNSFSSYGLELTGDMHFLRFYAPVELGVRVGYLPEVKQMDYGFLFSVDFTSL